MSFLKRLIPLKGEIELSLQNLTVESGQPLKGTASLMSKEGFKVEVFRLEVRVNESWEQPEMERDANGNERQVLRRKEEVVYSQDVPVSQAFDAVAGERKDFPFEVVIPMRSPSRYGGSISYSLKAVADVKGRPDITKAVNPMVVPVSVVPAAVQTGAVTQVIQKEVVKVPCKYCGSLVEISSSVNKCPNCGAPMALR